MNETTVRILAELHEAAQLHSDWAAVLSGKPTIHIAIMSEPYLSYVFTGKKTVESRFSLHRIAPYNHIKPGDIVLMKAGALTGCFTAAWVEFYNLAEHPLEDIANRYGQAICADADFWIQKSSKRYATLIGIKDVRRLPPLHITKADRRAWLTL